LRVLLAQVRDLLMIQGAQLWAHGDLQLDANIIDDDEELDARLQRNAPCPPLDLAQVS
jgi:hypothetical protein